MLCVASSLSWGPKAVVRSEALPDHSAAVDPRCIAVRTQTGLARVTMTSRPRPDTGTQIRGQLEEFCGTHRREPTSMNEEAGMSDDRANRLPRGSSHSCDSRRWSLRPRIWRAAHVICRSFTGGLETANN